jgi:hypothetical protein
MQLWNRMGVMGVVACALGCGNTAESLLEAASVEAESGLSAHRGALTVAPEAPLAWGAPTRFLTTGASPGERVVVMGTAAGVGAGPCPGVLGGLCMDIRGPLRMIGSADADIDGNAAIPWTLPASGPAGLAVSVQAVVLRGASGSDSLLSAPRTDAVGAGGGAVSVDTASVDFGAIPPGCADSRVVVLSNDGGVAVTVSSATAAAPFFTDGDLPAVLMPGDTVDLVVGYAPDAADTWAGTVMVTTTAGDVELLLEGSGVPGTACPGAMTVDLTYQAAYQVADVAFLVDTTCSMSGTVDALTTEFAALAAELQGAIPDISFGLASFDDYNHGSFGAGLDKPFELRQQQTTAAGDMMVALNSMAIHSGSDGPESSIEALYQALRGSGYDQDCDGSYDSSDDVRPFIASPLDAFGGGVAGLGDPGGIGVLGGMGFRTDVAPILVYATDNELRDPDAGDATPGGCYEAGTADLVAAADAMGAKVIGIAVNDTWGDFRTEMEQLALDLGSAGDLDGDGVLEPAVLGWSGGGDAFRNAIVQGVRAVAEAADFGKVTVAVVDDPAGLFLGASPAAHYAVPAGTALEFALTVDGTLLDAPSATSETIVVGLRADDHILLDTFELYVEP